MIEIEKGVPIPNSGRGPGAPRRSARHAMEIGDSYFVKTDKPNTEASAARQWGRRFGKKFSARPVDGGVRIWRVA